MNRCKPFVLLALLTLLAAAPTQLPAALRMPAVFSDHAMLQAGKPVAIWGWADPQAKLTVTFKSDGGTAQPVTATADDAGQWSAQLPAQTAGTAGAIEVRTATGETHTISDVLVGEVWLCGGQSNMSYLVFTKSNNAHESTTPELFATAQQEATAAAGNLRYFDTAFKLADSPLDDVRGKWVVATPDTVGKCFALSWNFAVALCDKLHVPVGVIDSAVGGTAIEPWTPGPELAASPVGPAAIQRYQERISNLKPEVRAKSEAAMADWKKQYPTPELQRAHLDSQPLVGDGNPNMPSRLYNAMIRGLEPYTIRGFLWFQGDGNLGNSQQYGSLVQTLITARRQHFHDDKLPFLYVEMQNYGKRQDKPVDPHPLCLIREAQQDALKLPGTDVATAIDQGVKEPPYEAHFPDKKQLGQRLANLAGLHAYGQTGPVHSPALKTATVEGDKIRLKLDHAEGLRLRTPQLQGLAIRGATGDWVWAEGRIDGEDILVWNPSVPAPTEVRYAWSPNPLVSVENGAGLPLRPFRTDKSSSQ